MSNSPREHSNRLIHETSPYLLQHARNPVDWYPWGPEALERARRENKPIFLSIGYSACHWCHVMERESFENEAVAERMNRWFVNIKVDREERPDLDEIYMKAVQAMTGTGGWPMSVFLTPQLEPFFGGTYFPPLRMHGRPGFPELLEGLARVWEKDRASLEQSAARLTEHIRGERSGTGQGEISPQVFGQAFEQLGESFDPIWGGFGNAPKFPHTMDLRLLLRHWRRTRSEKALQMATRTLDRMAEGGMYDQLGGGFHRYSTDEQWLIPHFEKMLYDNALLVPVYLEAHCATRDENYARVARECCEWMLREMSTDQGGFASSQDADSEGEEGKFFAWSPRELTQALGDRQGAWAAAWFGVSEEGNFEHGRSALWRHDPPEVVAQKLHVKREELEPAMLAAREMLLAARERRVRPATDDKILASWNGLAISALAQAHQVLGEERFLQAARRAADCVLAGMRQKDGALFATARGGRAHLNAYLDDYAFVIQGLIDLYESDFDARWLREALALERIVAERFEDPDQGGFFSTSSDHEQLLARLKSPNDGALPAGSAVHVLNLLRLSELTGRADLARRSERAMLSVGALANRFPVAFAQLLIALDFLEAGPREIVVAGIAGSPEVRALLDVVRHSFLPQRVVALASPDSDTELLPILAQRTSSPGKALAFVCRQYACQAPVATPAELAQQLQ
jgi:uncharacterized protein